VLVQVLVLNVAVAAGAEYPLENIDVEITWMQ
jgi:hypothetical protein